MKKNKALKIALISVGSLVGLLVLVAILVPVLFKDNIKRAVDDAIQENINAEVIYSVDDVSLSLITSFPELRFGIANLTVKNNAPFKGDTLTHIGDFNVFIDIWKYITDSKIFINRIQLESPLINVKVNAQGVANYDIFKSDSTQPEDKSESSPLNLTLDKWTISNARIAYEDSTLNMFLHLDQLNQEGFATLEGDKLHAKVETSIDAVMAKYGTITYLKNHRLFSKINLDISEDYTRYTLQENEIKLNDFALFVKGFFKMQKDAYDMDLSFATNENTFKNVLSLVPAVYTSSFDKIKTNGTFSFSAFVKGMYQSASNTIPHFKAELKVRDGYVIYPGFDLPVEKIMMDVVAQNETGKTANTNITLNDLSMQIAQDPISIKGTIANINDFHFITTGRLKLDNLKRVYTVEGMDMSGLLNFNLDTKGKLDDVNAGKYQLVKNEGALQVQNVVIKQKGYPTSSISDASLKFNANEISIDKVFAKVGKSDFDLKGKISNYMDYVFTDKGVLRGSLTHNSKVLDLNEWMSDDATPSATTEKKETTAPSEPTTPSTDKAYAIPKNLALSLNSNIDHIAMLDMPIDHLKGRVELENGILSFKNTMFQLLEGTFTGNGEYNTADTNHPKFAMDMKAKNISIKKANATFNTVKKLAPIAENIAGYTDIDIAVASEIDGSYFPIYKTMNGKGRLYLQGAGIQEFKPINSLSSLTGIKELNNPTLKKTAVDFAIQEGKLVTQPFNIDIANFKSTLNGFTTLDGNVNYTMEVKVPANEIGGLLKNLAGVDIAQYGSLLGELPLHVDFKGKYNQVKPSINAELLKKSVQDQLKSVANKKVDEGKQVAKESVQKAIADLTNPNDKRDTKEKVNDAVEQGKKKLLDLFGKPK